MNKRHDLSKIVFGIFVGSATLSLMLVSLANAERFYMGTNPNGLNECYSTSGGRDDFMSVDYACKKAYYGDDGPQNACASWLGSTSDSVSRTVNLTAVSENDVLNLSFWGMCTDRSDRSTAMYVMPKDGNGGHGRAATGIVDSMDDSSKNFVRSGTWGSPSSKITELYVADFIKTATLLSNENGKKVYKMRVWVDRRHSDNPSMGLDETEITVTVGGKQEPQIADLCKAWEPSSYPASNANNGTTSIVVKAMNTAGRFPAGTSGDWHHNGPGGLQGPIYAMPTDNIRWHSCYYPGVQTTANTQVSDINGVVTNGGTDQQGFYDKPRVQQDVCEFHPTVGYKKLYIGYGELVGTWENKYRVGSELGSASGGDYGPGVSSWRKDFERDGNRGMGQTRGNDVGRILTQEGTTGAPRLAVIGSETVTHDVVLNDGACYTDEELAEIRKSDPSFLDPMNCPVKHCTNSFKGDIKSASVDPSHAQDDVNVIVPYNFQNSTGVDVEESTYAGESVEVNEVWVDVGTKQNNLTYANYATVVPEAQVKLFMYASESPIDDFGTSGDASCEDIGGKNGQCRHVNSAEGLKDLNASGNLDGARETIDGMARSYNAFDISAGDYVCFVAAVYPWKSGADDATGDTAGDGTWKYGTPDCAIVAKKPTFQVWGDSFYSNKNVITSVAAKHNIYNYYIGEVDPLFKIFGGTDTRFASWVEESLIIRDTESGTGTFASGAAMGRDSSIGNYAKVGAVGNYDFCKRSPLSFSNIYCTTTNGFVRGADISSLVNFGGDENSQDLIRYWVGDTASLNEITQTSDSVNLNSPNSVGVSKTNKNGMTIRYAHPARGADLSISGDAVPDGTTYLIKVDGTAKIGGNIRYSRNTYDLVGKIPKVIIYANNINISCGVDEVDAILITTGNLNTCSDVRASDGGNCGVSQDEYCNAPERARQLKIFGTVMANSVTLGRTYGAAAWDPSRYSYPTDGEAAEVFDYDTSIPMWSEYMGGAAETDTLQTVYQHELAPRY